MLVTAPSIKGSRRFAQGPPGTPSSAARRSERPPRAGALAERASVPPGRTYDHDVTPKEFEDLVLLRRARDRIDREFAMPLDVPAMASVANMSPSHFSRRFREVYGETPYAYLMTRRIERAKEYLRAGMTVTESCFAVGCTSLGSFSSRFTELVGEPPSRYRARDHRADRTIPTCVSRLVTRPRRHAVAR